MYMVYIRVCCITYKLDVHVIFIIYVLELLLQVLTGQHGSTCRLTVGSRREDFLNEYFKIKAFLVSLPGSATLAGGRVHYVTGVLF